MGDVVRVLFGTETGTAEMCAADLVDALKKKGFAAKLVDMDDYEIDGMADERLVVVITSTFGNGDPPANAERLLESLNDDRPDLNGLNYAVMALGDTSYPRFAQCGKDFDKIIGELGGNAVIPRVDCDGDVGRTVCGLSKRTARSPRSSPRPVPSGRSGRSTQERDVRQVEVVVRRQRASTDSRPCTAASGSNPCIEPPGRRTHRGRPNQPYQPWSGQAGGASSALQRGVDERDAALCPRSR